MRCIHCMTETDGSAGICPCCGEALSEPNPPHRLTAGTVLNGRYLVGTALGEGGFGITYVGFDQTLDIKVAVKEYFPSGCATRNSTVSNDITLNISRQKEYYQNGKERFLQEARSIARFSKERGVVDVRDFFTENNTAYIIMEYLEGKTLMQHLREEGTFPSDELLNMMLPLMRTLEKMHNAGIIHRDISPDNIMLENDGTLRLIDFGAARYFAGEETRSLSVLLRPGYAPYEQYSRKGEQGSWTDVYALCATIYKCITGYTPPDSLDRCMEDTIESPIELDVILSPQANAAIMRGLAVYPKNRIKTVGELIDLIYAEPEQRRSPKIESHNINHTYDDSKTVSESKPVFESRPVSENGDSDRTRSVEEFDSQITADRPDDKEDIPAGKSNEAAGSAKTAQKPEEPESAKEPEPEDSSGKKTKKKKLIAVIIAGASVAAAALVTATVLNLGGAVDLSDKIKAAAEEGKTFSCSSNRVVTIDSGNTAAMYSIESGKAENISAKLKSDKNLAAVESSEGVFLGLKTDGTVSLLYGNVKYGDKLASWKDLTDFSVGRGFIIGLKSDGTVIAEGEAPTEKVKPLDVSEWKGIKDVSADWITLGLKDDGTVMYTDYPEAFVDWSNVSALTHERTYLAVKKDGTIAFKGNTCPDNWKEAESWTNIVSLSAQGTSEKDHIVGLTADGKVKAAGNNDCGQCEVSGWEDIAAVHTSKNYTVGKKSDGTYLIATNDSALKESFEKIVNSK